MQKKKSEKTSKKFIEPEVFVSGYGTNHQLPKCKICEVRKWLDNNHRKFTSSEEWRESLIEFLEKTFL